MREQVRVEIGWEVKICAVNRYVIKCELRVRRQAIEVRCRYRHCTPCSSAKRAATDVGAVAFESVPNIGVRETALLKAEIRTQTLIFQNSIGIQLKAFKGRSGGLQKK